MSTITNQPIKPNDYEGSKHSLDKKALEKLLLVIRYSFPNNNNPESTKVEQETRIMQFASITPNKSTRSDNIENGKFGDFYNSGHTEKQLIHEFLHLAANLVIDSIPDLKEYFDNSNLSQGQEILTSVLHHILIEKFPIIKKENIKNNPKTTDTFEVFRTGAIYFSTDLKEGNLKILKLSIQLYDYLENNINIEQLATIYNFATTEGRKAGEALSKIKQEKLKTSSSESNIDQISGIESQYVVESDLPQKLNLTNMPELYPDVKKPITLTTSIEHFIFDFEEYLLYSNSGLPDNYNTELREIFN
jgi:hypothetical protein